MNTKRIYLDYNATPPIYPEVADKMREILCEPANPSSVHSFGREARKQLEQARTVIAQAISAWPNEVTFTASATEANAMALRGVGARRVLVSAIEHSSVLRAVPDAQTIPVQPDGRVNLSSLEQLLANGGPALVSLMLANNETGVIQPVTEASTLCRKYGALLHCDAVQAPGKIPLDFSTLGVDMMTVSGHKCGGPVGAAALVIRRDLPVTPLLSGGGQELGRRAGTENVAAIAGFALAMEKSTNCQPMNTIRLWLDALEEQVIQHGGVVFGRNAPRLPNTSCLAMPGVGQEVQLMDFDLKGFAVSAGSACSSGKIEVSHVLTAMGIDKTLAGSAIRISAGWQTVEHDIIGFGQAWLALSTRLGKSQKTA